MDATVGRETDALTLFAALSETPYRHDFYQTLRRLECLFDSKPRWGHSRRPVDDAVRFGQQPELSFAPAPLSAFEIGRDGRPSRLSVRLFGLLGPNGPLPLHLTEYARDRLYRAGDPTLSRFLDLFHHRFVTLFYRAWAQAQPHVNRDRPKDDRFATYIAAFMGLAPGAVRDRDRLPDLAKFFHVGALIRHTRNAEGLRAILQHFFRVPVQIEEFVGQWMALDERDRTYLGREGATLGSAAVAGLPGMGSTAASFACGWDRSRSVSTGRFCPGERSSSSWSTGCGCTRTLEFAWDVRLICCKKRGAVAACLDGRADWDGPPGSASATQTQMPTISASRPRRSPAGRAGSRAEQSYE